MRETKSMRILAHNGKAHQDDFLAACVCCYKLDTTEVFRDAYKEEDLNDPNCWVLDQGRKFEPELHNFDHHQIEEEICAFTMVLDHFYGKKYREYMPQLRFVEIYDSYGPKKAAEFVEMKQDNLDVVLSPIHTSMMRVFSKIEGRVKDPMLSIMKEMGFEICSQIENTEMLLKALDEASYFEYKGINILDNSACVLPEGIKHDVLPTKLYSKIKDIYPGVILTKDSRQEGYRMVSTNTDCLKFLPNPNSYFVHNSGFLVGFKKYEDYKIILENYADRSR
jgi:hypothetical protein